MEVLKDILTAEDSLKEIIRVIGLRRTREEILILSVDKEVDKAMIVTLISNITSWNKICRKSDRKIKGPSFVWTSKNYSGGDPIRAKSQRANYMEYTNSRRQCKLVNCCRSVWESILLMKKRVCIDFERYRVVETIPITWCFKWKV